MSRAISLAVSGVAFAALLGGCAHKIESSRGCHGPTCHVAVLADAPDAHGRCQVKVDADELQVDRRDGGVRLQWKIDPAAQQDGYKFGRFGIVIADIDPPQFEPPASDDPHFSPLVVNWHDKTTVRERFEYIVYATRGGKPCVPLDPYIYNR
jgi:hypothetical protein